MVVYVGKGHVSSGFLFRKVARVCKSNEGPVDNIVVCGNMCLMQGPIRVNLARA